MFIKLSLAIGVAALVAGCGDKAGSSSAAQAAVASVPAMPTHFYSIQDGREYGYEQAISENARKQGAAAAPLMMFGYLGRKGDTYQVILKRNNVRTIAECSKPCEFAKVYTFVGDRFMGKEMLKLTPEAIVSSVFSDAMSGQLNQFTGEQNGTVVTFWVDGDAKRLIVDDAKSSGVVR